MRTYKNSKNKGYSGGKENSKTMLYDAVCSDCGDECKVPFKPTKGKPVLCRNCFQPRNGDSSDRRNFRRDNTSDRGGNDTRQLQSQIDVINRKLDRIIKILEE